MCVYVRVRAIESVYECVCVYVPMCMFMCVYFNFLNLRFHTVFHSFLMIIYPPSLFLLLLLLHTHTHTHNISSLIAFLSPTFYLSHSLFFSPLIDFLPPYFLPSHSLFPQRFLTFHFPSWTLSFTSHFIAFYFSPFILFFLSLPTSFPL